MFLHRIVSGDDIERRNAETWKQDSLDPKGKFLRHYLPPAAVKRVRQTPDSINKTYAGYYLRYMLPEAQPYLPLLLFPYPFHAQLYIYLLPFVHPH